jgi:hypothetical protein
LRFALSKIGCRLQIIANLQQKGLNIKFLIFRLASSSSSTRDLFHRHSQKGLVWLDESEQRFETVVRPLKFIESSTSGINHFFVSSDDNHPYIRQCEKTEENCFECNVCQLKFSQGIAETKNNQFFFGQMVEFDLILD